jgi:hypothetical protein
VFSFISSLQGPDNVAGGDGLRALVTLHIFLYNGILLFGHQDSLLHTTFFCTDHPLTLILCPNCLHLNSHVTMSSFFTASHPPPNSLLARPISSGCRPSFGSPPPHRRVHKTAVNRSVTAVTGLNEPARLLKPTGNRPLTVPTKPSSSATARYGRFTGPVLMNLKTAIVAVLKPCHAAASSPHSSTHVVLQEPGDPAGHLPA